MSDYIEREAVLQTIESCAGWSGSFESVYEEIQDMPAADVAPVRHGYWIHDINNQYGCSECMGKETMPHKSLKPYCPNCGARMDKEDEHEAG